MNLVSVAEALSGKVPLDSVVTVRGWVRSRRDSKAGLSFVHLHDGSCFAPIQVVAPAALSNYTAEVLRLTTGCAIVATGRLVASTGKGQSREVQAESIRVAGWVDDPDTYPVQPKQHSFEYLRTVAHLRPRTNTFGAITRLRHTLAQAIHRFFDQHGFYWVHTPIITASDCEGAGAMFKVSTLDLMNLPRKAEGGEVESRKSEIESRKSKVESQETGAEGQKPKIEGQAGPGAGPGAAAGGIDFARDFFGKPAFLTVSGQLNVECYACALSKVYTFGPTFRAENSNTARHLAEFWMVEPEVAFNDLSADADLAESFLKFIFEAVLAERADDMAFFAERIDKDCIARVRKVIAAPFERMTYTDAIAALEKAVAAGRAFEFPVRWGMDMQSEHERYLTEELVGRPVIVMNYPKEIKAFYMRLNDDGRTVAAMDVLAPGIGEIIGGSQREERLDVLDRRLTEMGLDPRAYWWYRDLRRYGTVPHAGFGLGFERTIQYVTGMANIRDVIPFPRTPGSAEF